MRALPVLLLASAAAAACATAPMAPMAPMAPASPPERAFLGVKVVALVHRVDRARAEPPRRDALDGLQAVLEGRGVATVAVELPDRPPPELEDLDRLARQAELAATAGEEAGGAGSVGAAAAPVLARLKADALALHVRRWGVAPQRPSPFQPLGQHSLGPPASPQSTLALVARDGTVLGWTWGGAAEPFRAGGPANAAEAIDAAVAVIAGAPGE